MFSFFYLFFLNTSYTIISSKIYEILTTLYSNSEIREQMISLDIEASIKNMELLIDDLNNVISNNDIIYVKGSRGLKMENIIKGLK